MSGQRRYENEDTASEALIPDMLDDIGVEDEVTRQATEAFAREHIEGTGCDMGSLQSLSAAYAGGYERGKQDCQRDS